MTPRCQPAYGNVIVFPVGGQRTDVDLSSILSCARLEGRASLADRSLVRARRTRYPAPRSTTGTATPTMMARRPSGWPFIAIRTSVTV